MKYTTDENGFFGGFGGSFIPEMLYANVAEIQANFKKITQTP